MRSSVEAELVKAATTRSAAAKIAGATVLAVLVATASVLSVPPGMLEAGYHTQQFFLLASVTLTLFATVVGVSAFTDEYRYGLVVPSVVAVPDRRRLFAAKAAVAVLVAALLAVVAQVAMAGAVLAIAPQKGASLALERGDLAAAAGLVLACALWAVIGAGVGALVRQPVAAVVGVSAWIVVVENAAGGLLLDAARFLPGQAGHALALVSREEALLSPVAGGVLLLAYAAALTLLALLVFGRRDVEPA